MTLVIFNILCLNDNVVYAGLFKEIWPFAETMQFRPKGSAFSSFSQLQLFVSMSFLDPLPSMFDTELDQDDADSNVLPTSTTSGDDG